MKWKEGCLLSLPNQELAEAGLLKKSHPDSEQNSKETGIE
jgi:hypothetical protein